MVIEDILHIFLVYMLWCLCIQSFILNKWYHSTFIGRHCGQIFFFFCIFFFLEKKKRVATFQKFSVYFCEKIVEIGCGSEFLL
jgi:hypothetical protein